MFPTIQVLIEMSVHVNQAKAAMTQSARDKKEKEIGARYSELLRLKYFDIVRCHHAQLVFRNSKR